MIKEVKCGTTNFENLHEVFKMSKDEFEARRARLFPLGNTDKETSTTSIFLSSLSAVKEYRKMLLNTIGVKKVLGKTSTLHVYTEIPCNNLSDRPDGLIVLTSGVKNPIIDWIAFVEVKVGLSHLEQAQIDRYIDFGKSVGIDNLISISNQLVPTPFDSPVSTRKQFELFHWSWSYLKVMSMYLVRNDMVEDEDHVYILKELRRYLEDHKNISHFEDMGGDWKESLAHIHALSHGQKPSNKFINAIVDSYSQEEKDLSLRMTDSSKYLIELQFKGDRYGQIAEMLQAGDRVVCSKFAVDGEKKNCFDVLVDFSKMTICYTYSVEIPNGKAKAQTTSLLKRLEGIATEDNIFVRAVYQRNKVKLENPDIPYSQLVSEKEMGESYSVLDKELGDKVKHFEIKIKDILGVRDFQGKRNFIVRLEEMGIKFVTQVIECLN